MKLNIVGITFTKISGYIYQEFFRRYEKEVSIHLTHWVKPTSIENDLINFGEHLKNVLFEMRRYKSEHNLSMRDEMAVLEIHTEKRFLKWFHQTEKDIRACTRTKKIDYILK